VLRIVLEGSRDPALEQRRARAGFSFVLERVLINAQIAVPNAQIAAPLVAEFHFVQKTTVDIPRWAATITRHHSSEGKV
jgi:hypothetical protein